MLVHVQQTGIFGISVFSMMNSGSNKEKRKRIWILRRSTRIAGGTHEWEGMRVSCRMRRLLFTLRPLAIYISKRREFIASDSRRKSQFLWEQKTNVFFAQNDYYFKAQKMEKIHRQSCVPFASLPSPITLRGLLSKLIAKCRMRINKMGRRPTILCTHSFQIKLKATLTIAKIDRNKITMAMADTHHKWNWSPWRKLHRQMIVSI